MTVAKTITNGDEPSDSGATELVSYEIHCNRICKPLRSIRHMFLNS
jgi:hypothetical protein